MSDLVNESYDYMFKVLCIGESSVGKTTLLHQYIYEKFGNFRSTIGVDIFEKYLTVKDDQRILLQLWDTAGQERYRSLTTSLYRDSMGFLLVFDVTNESSFLSIRNWLHSIENYNLMDGHIRPPILLIGNKIDLVTQRKIDSTQAVQLANDLGITYIETSAIHGTNVDKTLNMIIEDIFLFMDEFMEKYNRKQSTPLSSCTLCSRDYIHRRKKSIKLMKKLSSVKKTSCTCS